MFLAHPFTPEQTALELALLKEACVSKPNLVFTSPNCLEVLPSRPGGAHLKYRLHPYKCSACGSDQLWNKYLGRLGVWCKSCGRTVKTTIGSSESVGTGSRRSLSTYYAITTAGENDFHRLFHLPSFIEVEARLDARLGERLRFCVEFPHKSRPGRVVFDDHSLTLRSLELLEAPTQAKPVDLGLIASHVKMHQAAAFVPVPLVPSFTAPTTGSPDARKPAYRHSTRIISDCHEGNYSLNDPQDSMDRIHFKCSADEDLQGKAAYAFLSKHYAKELAALYAAEPDSLKEQSNLQADLSIRDCNFAEVTSLARDLGIKLSMTSYTSIRGEKGQALVIEDRGLPLNSDLGSFPVDPSNV